MVTLSKPHFTPQQYLEYEREADYRSEYLYGEIRAMAGASEQHNSIVTNVNGEFRRQFKGRPCKTYSSDMRVKISSTGLYTYPDVVALCGKALFEDTRRDTLLNPQVIIEVLSKTTEAYDRGDKSIHYRRLESLKEYVLIAQDKIHVEHFVKQSDGQWLLAEADDSAGIIRLASIDCDLLLAEVYDKVEFAVEESAALEQGTGQRRYTRKRNG